MYIIKAGKGDGGATVRKLYKVLKFLVNLSKKEKRT